MEKQREVFIKSIIKYIRVLLISLPLCITACGGGGGGNGSSATPSALNMLPTYTQGAMQAYTLSWPSVAAASNYNVLRNGTVIATDLTTTSYTDTQYAGQGGTYQIQACNSAGCSVASPGVRTIAAAIVSVSGVYLSNSQLGMLVGSTYQLATGVTPANATDKTVSWTSDNPSVATVSTSGVVTAVAPGTANLTVNTVNGNLQARATVTVSSTAVPLTGVSISPSALSLGIGNSQLLAINVTPVNATNQVVTWRSDNTAVATVDSLGNVTAVSAGSANVSATTADGGQVATAQITVTPPPSFTIGGTINGLTQPGLTLTLTNPNTGTLMETLPITPAQGSSGQTFTFNTTLTGGSPYAVSVGQNPSLETCAVSQGSGNVSVGNVSNINVACSTMLFNISGTISGLAAPNLKIDYYSGGEVLSVPVPSTPGNPTTFRFTQPVPANTDVRLAVVKQPYWQWCTSAAGNFSGALVANLTSDNLTCRAATETVTSTLLAPQIPTTTTTIFPIGLAMDAAGNIYMSGTVSGSSTNAIFKMAATAAGPGTGAITLFAGSPTGASTPFANGTGTQATFSNPYGLAVDLANNWLYVADLGNNMIRKIDLATAAVTTFAGNGTKGTADGSASSASFDLAQVIAVDPSNGDVYAGQANDTNNSGSIRKISGGVVTTFPAATNIWINGIAVNSGNVYYSDTNHNLIKKISTTGGAVSVIGGTVISNGAGAFTDVDSATDPTQATFRSPTGMVFDAFNNLYITEQFGCVVRKFTASTTTPGTFSNVETVAGPQVDPTGSSPARCSSPNNGPTNIGVGGVVSGNSSVRFGALFGLTIDASGNLYAADAGNGLIRLITPTSGQ